ncbi:MAG: PD-(D/E)XK nuclease family protein [Patescibacteria group bacterium]|nr:PD-(D/E)XK nuclease family protein [Patescibacteria group bacterium]MDE2588302.1 PD-(D/E)XK nuclease family protein [Patescibacteria group bacterium]
MSQQKQYPLWVSHSKLSLFIRCPRAYYLQYEYKDPKTGHKISIINPALALGNAVHEVFEMLLAEKVPAEKRMEKSLLALFNQAWVKFAGKAGGFENPLQEQEYKNRGEMMVQRVIDNPGPILKKTVTLPETDDGLPPRFLLSEKENILLCGKVDWLEYLPEGNAVHIIDFKTGKHDEDPNSLQLPIYSLLVKNLQKRQVKKISYWYLETDSIPKEMRKPDDDIAIKSILDVALQIKKARLLGEFRCMKIGGCFACRPLENIITGKAEFIRTSGYQDIYAQL